MPSLLELQDLYNEALVREIIEKTKNCGLQWNHLGGTQFQATETQNASPNLNIVWDFFITKTQIGNATYKYTLDIKKNAIAYITINDGPLPHTARSSVVKELYEIVEIIVLEMDQKLKETIRFVQQIADCRS
jgi:hypothetical protein